jgi:hypothetical protein
LALAPTTGHKIVGFSHRHRRPKIKVDPLVIAGGTRDFLQSKRHIRLCLEIEIHIGVDWESIKTLFADPSPFPIASHEAFIDPKAGLLANRAGHGAKATLDFLLT